MEVEIKARVKSLPPIRRRLRQLGAQRIKSVRQIDYYFSLYRRPYTKTKGSVVRVRHWESEDRTTLEYDTGFNQYAAEEIEIDVSSLASVLQLLKKFKATQEVRVDKRREYYKKGQYEIVLDQVKGLGTFIEVEIDASNTTANHQRVVKFMSTLGISPDQLVAGRYNTMLLKKKGKKYGFF